MSGCYGVSSGPSDGQWKCQRCIQEDQKAVESSVSRTVSTEGNKCTATAVNQRSTVTNLPANEESKGLSSVMVFYFVLIL